MTDVEWPRFYDGTIMWVEHDTRLDRTVVCPLCGAAVIDTQTHVKWHEDEPTP